MVKQGAGHLTDEQFADCALGMGVAEETAEHLAGCAPCSAEVAKFAATMDEFSTAALAWSESRSPLSLQQHTRARAAVKKPWFATASWAMAAGVVLAVGGTLLTHKNADAGPEVAVTSVQSGVAVDSETEIARDNELMRNVDMAINQSVGSPVSEYGLQPADRRQRRAAVESRMQ